ncbi:MAG TPA: type II toxin-antitoxin system PemK/MazF family toxin [Gemmataceae bacterium]|nr:type II toxin-antitoxin system PemK/MazF family toxin [Gemmataceae bacterium]
MTRGDVVLVDWPYSDRTGSKLRPAVVVQADYLNGLIDDTVLAQITSKAHGIPGTEVTLDPIQEPGSGLLQVSYVFCPNLMTAEQAMIDQTIGALSDQAMRLIDACLKSTLGIP